VSVDEVKANFARFGLLDDQVRFVKGWFDQSLPAAPIERIAILRVDGDLYDSTLAVLRHLHPRVSPGGYVIVDDYHHWPGCKEAVDTFLRESGIAVDIVPVDWGSAYWRVPREAR
jgi:O-methyltransferase